MTTNTQVNDSGVATEADSDDTKPPMKTSPPGTTVSSSEASTSAAGGTSDHQSCAFGFEPANCDAVVTSDACHAALPQSSENARETTEKSDGQSVSCFRDIIDSTIEKTLQHTAEQCRSHTPPPAVGGKLLSFTVSLLGSCVIWLTSHDARTNELSWLAIIIIIIIIIILTQPLILSGSINE